MVRTKPKPEYQAVSLPKEFVEKVRKHVLKSPDYRSIAEFTTTAVQEKMSKTVQSDLDILLDKLDDFDNQARKMTSYDIRYAKIKDYISEIRNLLKKYHDIDTVELPTHLTKKIDKYCKKHKITPSEYIRMLIDEELAIHKSKK